MEAVTLLILAVLTLTFLFFTTKYTYWKRRNVPGPTPIPILGNYKSYFTIKKTLGVTVQSIYRQFPNEPFVGAYFGTEPVLIPRDPEVIKTIMAKDFYNFSGRALVEHEYRDPFLSNNVFSSSGDNWKVLRQNLNPMFTSGKLKGFFHLIAESAGKLDNYVELKYKKSDVQDVKDIANRFVLDVVGSCLFGLNFESMCDEVTTIQKMATKLDEVKNLVFWQLNFHDVWPNIYHFITKKPPGDDKEFNMMFFNLAQQSFESRNYKPIGRKDLVDFLLKFKDQGFVEGEGVRNVHGDAKRVKIEVTEEMLASQVLIFFAAGFGTSSVALSFTLYELAKHPEIQQRLLEDIERVLERHNGEITYEAIQDMKYLDMVVSETLRKYPVLGVITRECMSDYKFADYDLKVEKSTRIHIPVWAIHHDPKYYPEPEKFDPERFSPEEVQKRHPYTYLAFGEGHRICIGLRFSKIQVALGLIRFLRKFRLEECDRTVKSLEFDPRGFAILSKTPLEVKMIPRNGVLAK